jgi:hypothetical protein
VGAILGGRRVIGIGVRKICGFGCVRMRPILTCGEGILASDLAMWFIGDCLKAHGPERLLGLWRIENNLTRHLVSLKSNPHVQVRCTLVISFKCWK